MAAGCGTGHVALDMVCRQPHRQSCQVEMSRGTGLGSRLVRQRPVWIIRHHAPKPCSARSRVLCHCWIYRPNRCKRRHRIEGFASSRLAGPRNCHRSVSERTPFISATIGFHAQTSKLGETPTHPTTGPGPSACDHRDRAPGRHSCTTPPPLWLSRSGDPEFKNLGHPARLALLKSL